MKIYYILIIIVCVGIACSGWFWLGWESRGKYEKNKEAIKGNK